MSFFYWSVSCYTGGVQWQPGLLIDLSSGHRADWRRGAVGVFMAARWSLSMIVPSFLRLISFR